MNTEQDYNKLKQTTRMQYEIIKRYENEIIPDYEKNLADLEKFKNNAIDIVEYEYKKKIQVYKSSIDDLTKTINTALETLQQQEIEYHTFRKFHEDSFNKYIEYEVLKQEYDEMKTKYFEAMDIISNMTDEYNKLNLDYKRTKASKLRLEAGYKSGADYFRYERNNREAAQLDKEADELEKSMSEQK